MNEGIDFLFVAVARETPTKGRKFELLACTADAGSGGLQMCFVVSATGDMNWL